MAFQVVCRCQPVSAPSNSYQPSRHSGSRRFPVCHRLEAHLEFKSGTTAQRSQRQTKPWPLTRPVAQSRCSRLLQLPCHSTSQREARAVPSSALLAVVGNRRLPQPANAAATAIARCSTAGHLIRASCIPIPVFASMPRIQARTRMREQRTNGSVAARPAVIVLTDAEFFSADSAAGMAVLPRKRFGGC